MFFPSQCIVILIISFNCFQTHLSFHFVSTHNSFPFSTTIVFMFNTHTQQHIWLSIVQQHRWVLYFPIIIVFIVVQEYEFSLNKQNKCCSCPNNKYECAPQNKKRTTKLLSYLNHTSFVVNKNNVFHFPINTSFMFKHCNYFCPIYFIQQAQGTISWVLKLKTKIQ